MNLSLAKSRFKEADTCVLFHMSVQYQLLLKLFGGQNFEWIFRPV